MIPHKPLYLLLLVFLSLAGFTHAKPEQSKQRVDPAYQERQPVAVPADHKDSLPFQFKTGDKIAILGNAVADRMQHDGWLEACLQSQLKGKKVTFRNLAISGDTIHSQPRVNGFPTMTGMLQHVQADVILCMFGYNESYDDKAESYTRSYVAFINKLRAMQPNGKSLPRIVICSPSAHEQLSDSSYHNVAVNNKRLQAYAKATEQAAQQAGVTYLNLYDASQKWYSQSAKPLTINGIHFNAEGNYALGNYLAQELAGAAATNKNSLKKLQAAVKEKNFYWHKRYRAVDGNDVWGGRSKLAFSKNQTNAEVLQHEMILLDQYTNNRDAAVWAAAEGKVHKIDDSNVPKPIEVLTNVGGGSKSSNAAKEGNKEYLAGEDGLAKLKTPAGLKVNLFADETMFPKLANPVQMQVDARGRVWVAAWGDYPKWTPGKEHRDCLLVLEDTDGDGKADKSTEFAQVDNPLGFEFWNGGVLVTSQPDLIFLKDTNGDGKADFRQVVLSGMGSADSHHAANNLVFGPDGGIYFQSGIFLVNNFESPWRKSLRTGSSAMFRFDPRYHSISLVAANSPNPHGTSFDFWGNILANDGTMGRAYHVMPQGDKFRMKLLKHARTRPVAANAIVSSANFPDELQQNLLLCNTIGFLGIRNYKLNQDGGEIKGKATYAPGEIFGTKQEDMLVSEDKNFRPTDAVFGADGALYVSDWHNVIIGHMQHHVRDPSRDKSHGRIYRIANPNKPLQKSVKIHNASIVELLENLKHPINGVRHRSRVELSKHSSADVIGHLDTWVKQFDPKKKEHQHHLLEALWTYQRRNVRKPELLQQLLDSPVPYARYASRTVEHFWTKFDTFNPAKNKEAPKVVKHKTPKVKAPKHLAKNLNEAYKLGAAVYQRDAHCVTCHQADGNGLAPVYPPLAGSKWVTGDKDRLINIILHGIHGKMTVKGKLYDPSKGVPPMTAFKSLLTDKDAAALATYVRNAWGNKASEITASDVKKIRAATKNRDKVWQADELLKLHPMK